MKNNNNNKKVDIYELVTNRIIELLEKGVVPWQKPWTEAGLPQNLISGKNYRGINVWLLSSLGYSQNNYLTFKQVQELGGTVKKGEKANLVIFWKWLEKENPEIKKIEKIPLLRYYNVFNVDQCAGIPIEKLPTVVEREHNPIEVCENIINGMPKRPDIRFKEQQAYYHRVDDFINMPNPKTFKDDESYYGALFHELVHSTGHKERLDRRELLESKGMKTNDYAIEELTAEMGASYLKSQAGIPMEQLENNAAYIQVWLKRLQEDKKFIIHASTQAQKAVDYILNIREIEREVEVVEELPKIDLTEIREEELNKIRVKDKKRNATIERYI